MIEDIITIEGDDVDEIKRNIFLYRKYCVEDKDIDKFERLISQIADISVYDDKIDELESELSDALDALDEMSSLEDRIQQLEYENGQLNEKLLPLPHRTLIRYALEAIAIEDLIEELGVTPQEVLDKL